MGINRVELVDTFVINALTWQSGFELKVFSKKSYHTIDNACMRC